MHNFKYPTVVLTGVLKTFTFAYTGFRFEQRKTDFFNRLAYFLYDYICIARNHRKHCYSVREIQIPYRSFSFLLILFLHSNIQYIFRKNTIQRLKILRS